MFDDTLLEDTLAHIEELVAQEPSDQLAPTLEALASDLPRRAPGRAEYLSSAAEWYSRAKQYDDARRCLVEVMADGGETVLLAEAQLIALYLETGDVGGADDVARSLRRRARDLDHLDFELVAEAFEAADRPADAHRWYTLALRDDEPDELEIGQPAYFCALGRRRVREMLGLPPDRFDDAAEGLRQAFSRTVEQWQSHAATSGTKRRTRRRRRARR